MLKLFARLYNWLQQDEKGQGMVEYGLIVALIAIGVIVVLGLMKTELQNTFQEIVNGLKNAR